jgi:hypothetical protein
MTYRIPFRCTQYKDFPRGLYGRRPVLLGYSPRWLDVDDLNFLEQIRTKGRIGNTWSSTGDLFPRTADDVAALSPTSSLSLRKAEERSRKADRSRSAYFQPDMVAELEARWRDWDTDEAARKLRAAMQRARWAKDRADAATELAAEYQRQAEQQAQRAARQRDSDAEWDAHDPDPVRRAQRQVAAERAAKQAAEREAELAKEKADRIAKQAFGPELARWQHFNGRHYRVLNWNISNLSDKKREVIERRHADERRRRETLALARNRHRKRIEAAHDAARAANAAAEAAQRAVNYLDRAHWYQKTRNHIVTGLEQAARSGNFRTRQFGDVISEIGCPAEVLVEVINQLAREGKVQLL